MKKIEYIVNKHIKYHTRWVRELVERFFDILNISDTVEHQIYLLKVSESDKKVCVESYGKISDQLQTELNEWVRQGETDCFCGKMYSFSGIFTFKDIKGDFMVALGYNYSVFDGFIQSYLEYLVNHLFSMIEQVTTSVCEERDEAAYLKNLIYLWSREFVQDKIHSKVICLSQLSILLDVSAIEKLSKTRYEKEDVSGKFIAVSSDSNNKCEIILANAEAPVRLTEIKKIRKLLEITYHSENEGLYLLYNGSYMDGFISPGNITESGYLIEFRGAGAWRFNRISQYDYCGQSIEFKDNNCRIINNYDCFKNKIEKYFQRIFGCNDHLDDICVLIDKARDQKHGTILVFVEDAASEKDRLKNASFPIEIKRNPADYIAQLTAIDGAILLDTQGEIYAIGVILDGEMPENSGFDMARGARYNSAIKYSYSHRGKKNLCIVFSEDGYVNFISDGKEL